MARRRRPLRLRRFTEVPTPAMINYLIIIRFLKRPRSMYVTFFYYSVFIIRLARSGSFLTMDANSLMIAHSSSYART